METLLQDLRFAFRMLAKRPGFSLVVVLSLALGIGANSAIFSLVNGILLRPLPGVVHPEQLVGLISRPRGTEFTAGLSYPDWIDIREGTNAFSGMTATDQVYASMSGGGVVPELIYGFAVSGSYFSLLGSPAERGRVLDAQDDQGQGAHPVVVISHQLWERRFAGDPRVIGRPILLNGFPFTVVGVTPAGYIGTEVFFAPDFFVPMAMYAQIVPGQPVPFPHRDRRGARVLGRLRPGVDLAHAREQVQAVAKRLAREYPNTNEGLAIEVVPEGEARLEAGMGNIVSVASAVLLGLVGMVLLIACANVANLLLSQASARNREVCTRLAIGAGKGRLVRQLLTESLVLSLAGGALGLLLAVWLGRVVGAMRPPSNIPFKFDFSLDHRVLIFTSVVSVLSGLIFGLAPALRAVRADLTTPLRAECGATGTRRKAGLRSALVITQVAVSLPLLIAAALFLQSLRNARSLQLGFNPRNVLSMTIDLALRNYPEKEGRRFFTIVEERVRNLPGVQSASLGGPIPLDYYAGAKQISVPGKDVGKVKDYPYMLFSAVEPGYFQTMETPLLSGRFFDSRDTETGAPVVVVNEALVKRYWPRESPIGHTIVVGGPGGQPCEIVGVVATGKYRILAEPPLPYFYRPFRQSYLPKMTLVVKTAAAPASMVAAVRQQVQALDQNLPIFDVRSLDDLINGRALMPFKVVTTLAGAFGLLGLILATVGLYGVQSYSVAQRQREIGVRMAMGARPGDVMSLVMRQGLTLILVGLAVGLGVGLLLAKVMARLLLSVSATDPLAYASVIGMLLVAGLLASFVPARRAVRLDPARTLRYE